MVIYFIGNILPNLISVPLAAYHSHQAWSQNGTSTSDFMLNPNSKFPNSTGIVNDHSRILTANQRNELSKTLHHYDVKTTREIVIVTIDSIIPYTDIQEYTTDLGNEWGIGKTEKDNGLIMVICKPCRKLAIATGHGTEKVLTDQICKSVIDNTMVPEFKNDKYYDGIKKGITELIEEWK